MTGKAGVCSRAGGHSLAAWAEATLPRLIDDASAVIVTRLPTYYGQSDDHAVSTDELSRSVVDNLRFVVQEIGNPRAPFDMAAPEVTGKRRAHQGVPLPEVIRAYRINFATL